MVDNIRIEKIINERKKLYPDDPQIIQKWSELIEIFTNNEKDTITYLNNCNKENIYWISEVFEDISEHLKSFNFIKCIENLNNRYQDLNLSQDIYYAKKFLQ